MLLIFSDWNFLFDFSPLDKEATDMVLDHVEDVGRRLIGVVSTKRPTKR